MSEKAASELLDAYVLAAFLEVSPATIRSWAHRGHISRRGTSREGWALYDVREVTRHAGRRSPCDLGGVMQQ